jgi:choline dehydrogenase
MMTRENRFDYIVVGSGSAGCVLAARLTEAPDVRVLLLEAGGIDRHPLMKMPIGFFPMMMDPRVGWGYATEPEPGLGGRVLTLPRGKLLGGSSSINGMLYGRGHPQDYELWNQQGCEGWSWAEVLPYFKRSESNWRGETAHHGGSGPLTVSRNSTDPTLFDPLMATARRRGHPVATDLDGSEYEGFGAPDFTVHKGHRGSTAKRYLEPIAHRPNLTVWLKSHVTRVLLEGRRAVGVEVQRDGQLQQVRAEREVLLSAGSYGSPQILMLSGIGPADELRSAGVPPVHDLPGVGANLQEHAGVGALFAPRKPIRLVRQMRLDRMVLSVIRWRLFGTGTAAHLPLACIAFIRSRPELQRPDVEFMVNATGIDARIWFPLIRKPRGNALLAMNILLHPQSRGSVKLRSSNPKDSPRIQLNLLTEEADRGLLRTAFREMRTFFQTPPAAELVVGEQFPGPSVQSDAEIDAHMRAFAAIAHHPTSTCAMGGGRDAVLDAQMRVRGIDALRVIDASAMPQVVGGHTNAVTIMMAEKGADLVRGRSLAGPPAS